MIQGWVRDLADGTACRGVPVDGCPHPADDLAAVVYYRWHALRCGWCGALVLTERRD